jgi:hypothetical protein
MLDVEFGSVFPHLPLFHRLGHPLRDAEASLAQFEIQLEVPESKAARARLGTDRSIFASFGVAAYRDPPVVLCFGPAEEERSHRQSVPWDSRGAGRAAGWSDARRVAMIATYSLGAPEDERYLAAHLATCFQKWDTFLSGGRPIAPDPEGVLAPALHQPAHVDTAPLTTPEARFDTDVTLGARLLAAFVDADYPGREGPDAADWRKTFTVIRRVLEKHGRHFEAWRRYQSGDDIRTSAAVFIRDWLRDGGDLP